MGLVLIVDDEPSIRRSMRRMLERGGHEVLESANGLEALSLLEHTTPDFLITDLHMPGCDGFELAHALRAGGRPQPKIIVLSGDEPKAVLAKALTLGATALRKPFTMEELLADVANAREPPQRDLIVE